MKSGIELDPLTAQHQGPYVKNFATEALELLINHLCNPEFTHQFSITEDGLIVTTTHSKTGIQKKHYINLLLASADLTQINIEKLSLDNYLKKCKEMFKYLELSKEKLNDDLHLDSIEDFERIYSNRKPLPALEFTQAHRFAILSYAGFAINFCFNNFLRGDIKFLTDKAELRGENSDYFQFLAFYTISTLLIATDGLRKIPTEISDQKQIASTSAYRIQIHKPERLPYIDVVKGVKIAKEAKTDTFLVSTPSLISTSIESMDFDLRAPKGAEIAIAIRYDNEHKKSIDELSPFSDEKELILTPTDVQYTLLADSDPFLILDAKTIRPIDRQKNDNYILQHALRYVDNIVKQKNDNYILQHALRHVDNIVSQEFKQSTKDDLDHELVVFGDQPAIQRPNHGIVHAARQARNILDAMDYFLKYTTGEIHDALDALKKNAMLLKIIQIAAMFLSVGRENEKSAEEDMSQYIQSRASSTAHFEKYIDNYFADSLQDTEFSDMVAYCANMIYHLGSLTKLNKLAEEYESSKNSESLLNLIVFHLLTMAHLLDAPRFTTVKQSKFILEKRLFAENGGLIQENKDVAKAALNNIWQEAVERMRITGDRIIDYNDYSELFYKMSKSIRICEESIQLIKENIPIIPLVHPRELDDQEIALRRNDVIFNLIYNLFLRMLNKDGSIKEISRFYEKGISSFLDSILGHIQRKPELRQNMLAAKFISYLETDILIKKIQSLFASYVWLQDEELEKIDAFSEQYKIQVNIDYQVSYRHETQSGKEKIFGKFHIESLNSEIQQELKNACKKGLLPKSYSLTLKSALVKKIMYQDACCLANELLNEKYQSQFKLMNLDEDPTGILHIDSYYLIKYFKLTSEGKSEAEDILKHITDPRYLLLINCFQEIITKQPKNIITLPVALSENESLLGYQLMKMVAENPVLHINSTTAEQKVRQKNNPKSLFIYQNADHSWSICGLNSNGDFKNIVIKSEYGDDINKQPTASQFIFMFVKQTASETIDNQAKSDIPLAQAKADVFPSNKEQVVKSNLINRYDFRKTTIKKRHFDTEPENPHKKMKF